MACPRCGGEVRPVPFVYESGTTTSGSMTVGAGLAGGHIIPFLAGSSGQSQSLFIRRLAPPKAPIIGGFSGCSVACAWYLCFLCGAIGLFLCINELWVSSKLPTIGGLCLVISLIWMLMAVTGRRKADEEARQELQIYRNYKQRLIGWRLSTVCLNCGTIFGS